MHCTSLRGYKCGTESKECANELAHSFSFLHLGDEIKEGDIRLVGGRYLWEGRVEIFLHNDWGTISDDGAGITDA